MPTFTPENHRRPPPPPLPQCLSRSQRKLLLFFLKCVIMVVVTSLFLFFLGFAAIVLLHFLLMSTAFRRRCHIHSTGAASTEASPHSPAFLPGVSYNVAAFPTASVCAICLDSFREGDLCGNIPVCKHLFHAECVDRWIRKKPTCPVCRGRVDLGSPDSRIDGGDQWKRLWAVGFEEGTSY
ncbi:RING-H2 finger protein atl56 [Phtheirospermum japonicum]|uniref:RING-H2 finger protein atl56 n=1 Tax=Phtheirospermum japonicum TaxID=374723 RepID=A0A830DMA2_9LAMI|nr:RING-H2 finger protein atl56 [Phtheirospermum japonicum]